MINFKQYLEEKRGLWDNIHAKRKRIKNGSGEKMRKPGSKGAPTAADFKAANEEVEIDEAVKLGSKVKIHAPGKDYHAQIGHIGEIRHGAHKDAPKTYTVDYGNSKSVQLDKKNFKLHNEEVESQFDLIEEVIEELALAEGIDSESIWETLESVDDTELLEYAIDKKGHKSSTGGLTQKGVDAYNAKTGGHLQTAVTTKPSKLKPGSKAANRRKSFCARMGGVKGPMKDDKGRPTRKALALRKWNC